MQNNTSAKSYTVPVLTVYGSVEKITKEATQNWTVFDAAFPAGTPVNDLTFYS